MTTIRITIPGVPQQKGSRTHFRNGGSKDTNKNLEPWLDVAYERIRAAKGDHAGPLFFGPVTVTMIAYYPRRAGDYGTGRNAGVLKPNAPFWKDTAPDLDKLQRAVGDALQEAGLIVNDALIVAWDASKVYGDPRVDLIVADAGAIALDVVELLTAPDEQDTLL